MLRLITRFVWMLWLALLPVTGWAQRGDSLRVTKPQAEFTPGSYTPSVRRCILPVTLVAAGATGLAEPVKTWKIDVQDRVYAVNPTHRFYFDDYVQYVPLASALALDWAGVPARHDTWHRVMLSGTSYAAMCALSWGLKFSVTSMRPGVYYGSYLPGKMEGISPSLTPNYYHSFPSGHTATAFLGAELVRLEYGADSPWAAVGAYAVATGIGCMRVYNQQHWCTDVLAGAGIGILSARIGWWLLPWEQRLISQLFPSLGGARSSGVDASSGGHVSSIAVTPSTDGYHPTLAFSLTF